MPGAGVVMDDSAKAAAAGGGATAASQLEGGPAAASSKKDDKVEGEKSPVATVAADAEPAAKPEVIFFVLLTIRSIKTRQTKFLLQTLIQAFFLDKIPEHLPTRNWRILEFWDKFLEFFVKFVRFFLEILEFFSLIIQFHEFKVNIHSKTSIL